MEIRLAKVEDLAEIFTIYEKAKQWMAAKGIQQWTQTYPNQQLILKDIENHCLYSGVIDNQIVTVAVLQKETKEVYWLKRLATNLDYYKQGCARELLNYFENQAVIKNGKILKSSTHHSNSAMQNFFSKNEFQQTRNFINQERADLGIFYEYVKQL